jgi:hypothetical protein
MKKMYVIILLILAISISVNGHCEVTITNGPFDKINLGDKGAVTKALVNVELDRVEARPGKQICVSDPGVEAVLGNHPWTELSDAIKAIGSASTNLRLSCGTFNINVNLTIPSGITLVVEPGVTLSIATGVTLTITGGFQAGLYRVFACNGTGKVVFGSGAINKVYPQWWGAKGDGLTDDSATIAAACVSLGTYGGTVAITEGLKCLIDNNLTISTNTHLVGPHQIVGTPGNNFSYHYGNLGGALIIKSAKTVTLSSGASLNGLLIYRKGMTFPSPDSSAFAGTAVTIGGDDAAVFRCMILGFNKAIYSNGYQRIRCDSVLGDNNNGIEITACRDISYISNCHMWPFATIGSSGDHTILERSGTAYYMHDRCDWTKITNCFSFGYFVGFRIQSSDNCTLIGCSSDDNCTGTVSQHTGSCGFRIDGTAAETRLIGCLSASSATNGIYVNVSLQSTVTITASTIVNCFPNGVGIDSGDVIITGNTFKNVNSGIVVNNGSSQISIWGNRFKDIIQVPIYLLVNTSTVSISPDNNYGNYSGTVTGGAGSFKAPVIASSPSISLPPYGTIFIVSGTTSFGGLGGGYAGRTVTLIFQGELNIYNGDASLNGIRLAGGTTYTSAANYTLSLCHNGSHWFEVGRAN